MFDVFNIFEVFLPQLLRYPNPADPLNSEAAAILNQDKKSYENKIKEYIKKYASNPDFSLGDDDDSDEEEELSDVSSLSEEDEAVVDEEDEDDIDVDDELEMEL